MIKKLLGSMALAVGVFASLSAAAQAAPPQWLSDGHPIPAGIVEPVATSGKLTITVRAPTGAPLGKVKCKVKDKDNISNSPDGGIDEITAFKLTGCKAKPSPCPAGTKTEIAALGLPWRSQLVAGPPIRDEFFATLEIRCSGTLLTVVEGHLTPEVGKSTLVFGAGSGTISGSGGYSAEFGGVDKLTGPKNDKTITAA